MRVPIRKVISRHNRCKQCARDQSLQSGGSGICTKVNRAIQLTTTCVNLATETGDLGINRVTNIG